MSFFSRLGDWGPIRVIRGSIRYKLILALLLISLVPLAGNHDPRRTPPLPSTLEVAGWTIAKTSLRSYRTVTYGSCNKREGTVQGYVGIIGQNIGTTSGSEGAGSRLRGLAGPRSR